MAKLYFYYGAMGSSKTANALMADYNYRERGQKTILAKTNIDTCHLVSYWFGKGMCSIIGCLRYERRRVTYL